MGVGVGVDKAVASTKPKGVHMVAEGEFDRETIVHRKGYESFIGMMRIGAVVCFIIAMFVIFAIAK
ncbi:MAG: hypothetical protein JWO25_1053 [Alphaproteobacteria bacterium]|nr:hypothetical protein [Alphaproteobacteria bacterium]MDB5721406.1 hypothetical protein [Alphaproteobacteria bacterium]